MEMRLGRLEIGLLLLVWME